MKRTAWLAAVALTLVLGATFGQSRPGAEGGAGRDGRTGAGGFRAVGAFGGEVPEATQRSVQLEMEGGQKLDGTVQLRPILVDGDLGEYRIHPDKIKLIRFLKRANEDNADGEAGQPDFREVVPKKAGMRRRDRHGNVLVPDQTSPTGTAWLTHGKVITTSGKEIIGDIHIPTDFRLELEFGTLTPAPDKLRALTLTDAGPGGDGPAAGVPSKAGRPGRSGGPGGSPGPEVKKP
jgi:hypothetical protein